MPSGISLQTGAIVSRFTGSVLTFGLPAFDLHVTLLGLDGTIGLLVVGKQLLPPGLLLGGHFAPVGCRAQFVDLREDRRAALFEGFQFAHRFFVSFTGKLNSTQSLPGETLSHSISGFPVSG